jgi:hypothetical protein
MNTINENITAVENTATTPTPVNTLQKYYDKVFSDGKLVHVHIGMWGMSHILTQEDIMLEGVLPNTIQLGKKYLIKREVHRRFKNLEAKIRNYLYANSFSFPLVSQAHFVPKTKFVEVYNTLHEFRQEFLAMAEEFFDKYEDYKREALEHYREHRDTVNVDLERHYLPLEAIKKKFYMDIASFEISLPTNFKDIDIHTEMSREQAIGQAKSEAQNRYNQEYSKQVDLHMSKINDFVQDVVSTLRENIVQHCNVTLDKIAKREVVTDNSIKKLLGHISNFRSMNFMDDQTIERELSKVESLLNSDRDFSKDVNALHMLQTTLTGVVNEAKNINDFANVSGEYFRKIVM